MKTCQYSSCPYLGKEKYVGFSGKVGSKIMIIGERGSENECNQQSPFVGKAGGLLTSILNRLKIDRADCFITNSICCGNSSGRKPSKSELNYCKPYVLSQIKVVKPKLLILMGGYALYPLYDTITGIKRLHGRIQWNDEFNCHVLATYHPSKALRDKRGFVEWAIIKDIQRALSLIQGEWEIEYPNIKMYNTTEEIINFLTSIENKDFAYDIETNTLNVFSNDPQIACISFATDITTGHVIWLKDLPEDDKQTIIPYLGKIFNSPVLKIGANLKFDNLFLERYFGSMVKPKPPYHDVIIAHRMLYTSTDEHNLKVMACQFSNMPGYEKTMDSHKMDFTLAPKDILVEYAGRDAVVTYLSYTKMIKELEKERSFFYPPLSMYRGSILNMEAIPVISDIEKYGVYVDKEAIKIVEAIYKQRIEEELQKFQMLPEVAQLEIQLWEKEIAGLQDKLEQVKPTKRGETNRSRLTEQIKGQQEELEKAKNSGSILIKRVNIRSNPHLVHLLYDICGEIPTKKSKLTGKPSVDEESLKGINHPIVDTIKQYRHNYKMLNTYLQPIEDTIDPITGVIHPIYHINGAVSGRLTSGFHTYPAHGEDAIIRSIFTSAFPDGIIISADFSQIELRIAAILSEDPVMLRAFREGKDLHKLTASKIYNIPIEQVTQEQRQKGKTCNFALIFACSSQGLVRQGIATTENEGKYFLDSFFSLYKGMKSWMDNKRNRTEATGIAYSPLGWIRDLRLLKDRDLSRVIRQGINFPVQNIGGIYPLLSMVKLWKWLQENQISSRIIGTVHDSVYIDVFRSEAIQVITKFKEIAESGDFSPFFDFDNKGISLSVDFKVGCNMWMDKSNELPKDFLDNPTDEALENYLKNSSKKWIEIIEKYKNYLDK